MIRQLGSFFAPSRSPPLAALARSRPATPPRARRTYDMFCATCHGPAGKGDGPAAPRSSRRRATSRRASSSSTPTRTARPARTPTSKLVIKNGAAAYGGSAADGAAGAHAAGRGHRQRDRVRPLAEEVAGVAARERTGPQAPRYASRLRSRGAPLESSDEREARRGRRSRAVPAPAPSALPAPAPERGRRARRLRSSRYMAELRHHPPISREEEHELAVRWVEHGDVEAARRLVLSNLRLVVKIAMEYRRAWTNVLDLIQEGNVGLLQAVQRFDPVPGREALVVRRLLDPRVHPQVPDRQHPAWCGSARRARSASCSSA